MGKGIPTEYAGVRFRSRLEATWAVFFDLLNWPWEYEPFDLHGYIPDFVLKFRKPTGPAPVIVEVKPVAVLGELLDHADKIIKSGWKGDVLIVGSSLFEDDFGEMVIGHAGAYTEPAEGEPKELLFEFGNRDLLGARVFRCSNCRRVAFDATLWDCGLCATENFPPNPAVDRSVGDPGVYERPDPELIRSMWATAKNRVQWKGEFGA